MAKLEEVLTWPSVRKVCRTLDVHPNSAYAWAREGKVEAVQICGEWRINPRDVERIQRQRAERQAKKAVAQ